MGKKEVKTNAVRILERNKIEYELINNTMYLSFRLLRK